MQERINEYGFEKTKSLSGNDSRLGHCRASDIKTQLGIQASSRRLSPSASTAESGARQATSSFSPECFPTGGRENRKFVGAPSARELDVGGGRENRDVWPLTLAAGQRPLAVARQHLGSAGQSLRESFGSGVVLVAHFWRCPGAGRKIADGASELLQGRFRKKRQETLSRLVVRP